MTTTILIRDVPSTTTDEEFSLYFSTSVTATLKRNKNKQGLCRGFGFVCLSTKEEAATIMTAINEGITTPLGILRAELSNGGQKKKNRQKTSKKKKTQKGDAEGNVNLGDIGRFRSRRGKSEKLYGYGPRSAK